MKQNGNSPIFPLSARSGSRLAAYAVLTIACLTLVGWMGDITLLKSIRADWNSMKVITALCLIMAATALLWMRAASPWKRALCAVFGAALCAVAAVNIIVYATNLFSGHGPFWAAGPVFNLFLGPGDQMALPTALVFLGLGATLLLLRTSRPRLHGAGHVILLPVAMMSYLVLVGYIFDAPTLHEWLGVPVALHTGIALSLLCFGLFCARTDTWLTQVLTGPEAGAMMARRLLPPLLALPLVIGWLRVEGEHIELFESEIGVALVAATYAVCFLFLVWWNAGAANRQQLRAEAALREARDMLEARVRERTAELSRTVQALQEEVAQRVRAEETTRAAGLYARSLLEASLDPLVTISPKGKITDVNKATEDASGIPRQQLIGSDFSDYFTEPEKAREGYKRVLSEGAVHDYPLTVRHSSGRTMDVLYNATLYRDDSGKVLGVFAAARDVTERKAVEAELDRYRQRLEELVQQRTAELEKAVADLGRSNKDLEQFAYVASHDLQEPLRAVSGFVSILRAQYAEKLNAEAQEYIAHAVEGAERMQALINDLLAYSRLDSRGGAFKPIQMKDALDAALANLRAAITESAAVITCDPLPVIAADASQMIQLLQNLIGNAIKFRGPRPPEVHISARREEGRWLFGVRDNGIGIEPQYHERIFLIFQRLHSRIRYPGTGIGLAVCKRIVERHSGIMRVESKPGEGTTFYFTVPDKGEDA